MLLNAFKEEENIEKILMLILECDNFVAFAIVKLPKVNKEIKSYHEQLRTSQKIQLFVHKMLSHLCEYYNMLVKQVVRWRRPLLLLAAFQTLRIRIICLCFMLMLSSSNLSFRISFSHTLSVSLPCSLQNSSHVCYINVRQLSITHWLTQSFIK